MKQCILIISILLTCFLSFADETTSYAPRDHSPIANTTTTRTYIGEWERIGNNLWRIPTRTGHCDIDTQTDTKKHRIYVRDHLGSTRAVIDDAGELLQTVNYYASGVPFTLTQGETATDRLHSGKQFIDHQGLGYYDNSARMLDVLGGRFTTLDPMATDYGHLSPYTYCAANPLKYTDPDGKKIIATSLTAQKMILNTLAPNDRQAVQFNSKGQLNTVLLNKHISLSNNFANLVELENAKENIFVEISIGLVKYADNDGNSKSQEMYYWGVEDDFKDVSFELVSGNTTGETGRLGVTLLPGKGDSGVNSPNENIYIIINGHLSDLGAAETYCHEANGHVLIYIRTGDRNASRHRFENGLDVNADLVKMIRESRIEAVKNFNMQP